MTLEEFNKLTHELFEQCKDMRDKKGREYAGRDKDRLANFKLQGERAGVSPLTVWHIHFNKHMLSIDNYVKSGRVFSEPIRGRFVDAITYLLLGYGLIEEAKEKADIMVSDDAEERHAVAEIPAVEQLFRAAKLPSQLKKEADKIPPIEYTRCGNCKTPTYGLRPNFCHHCGSRP